MEFARDYRRFGIAWLLFALGVALHVTDEATHDFLTTYNVSVHAIRVRLAFLPIPTFTFAMWLTGLIGGIVLLLVLSPFAFRGNRALRLIAVPLGLIVGVFNAALHISSSIYFHRCIPGVYSSPFLLGAGFFLLYAAFRSMKHPAVAGGLT